MKQEKTSLQDSFRSKAILLSDRFDFEDTMAFNMEYHFCLYFDRMDIFAQMCFDAKSQGGPIDQISFGKKLREIKRTNIDPHDYAARLKSSMDMYNEYRPSDKTEKRKFCPYTQMEIPTNEEYIASYLSQGDYLGLNLNELSPVSEFVRPRMPDKTLSTICIEMTVNPRAHLIGADISGVTFRHDGAFFQKANFRGADLRYTIWHPTTSIEGALFEGANLTHATGMSNETLATAYVNEQTRFPAGTSLAAIKKIQRHIEMPPAPEFTDLELKCMSRKPDSLQARELRHYKARQPAGPQ